MGSIKAIRSEADYNAALARIEALMDAEPATPEGDELDVLADLVEHYERRSHPPRSATMVLTNDVRRDGWCGLSAGDAVSAPAAEMPTLR